MGAAIAACFSTPTRPTGVPDDSAVTGDGRRTDTGAPHDSTEADAMPGCTLESFSTDGSGCGPWASTSGSGISRAESLLILSVSGSGAGSSSCRTAPKAIDKVTFDVQSAYAGSAGEVTFVGFFSSVGSSYGVQFKWEPSGPYIGMAPLCPGTSSTSPLAQWNQGSDRFFRIQRNIGSSTTEILVGSSPSTLTKRWQCSGLVQFNTAEITTSAYRPGSGSGVVDAAALESVEYCP